MQLQVAGLCKAKALEAAVDAAERAGRFLLGRFGRGSGRTYTEKHDVKLDEDLRAEEIVRLCLCDSYEFAFIGEESCEVATYGPYVWVVDPLDGTANYERGIPHFSTSIALLEDGVPIIGVVRNHATGEMMTSIAGEGAWLNGVPLQVSKTGTLDRAVLSGGFMKTEEMVQRNLDFITRAVKSTFKLRVTGSAALELCEVAMGRFDIYSERGIRIWDIAAGLLIAREAGAWVSVSQIDGISFDVTVLNPILEREFSETFADEAPFTVEIPSLLGNRRE